MISLITLHGIILDLHIGHSATERADAQRIVVNLDFTFPKPPKACLSDQLTDTFCYSSLINLLESKLKNQSFYLIEHLAHWIYELVNKELRGLSKIRVQVTKYPLIPRLSQGVSFTYGDE